MNELARKQVGRQTDRQTGSVYWRPLTSRKVSLSLSLCSCFFLSTAAVRLKLKRGGHHGDRHHHHHHRHQSCHPSSNSNNSKREIEKSSSRTSFSVLLYSSSTSRTFSPSHSLTFSLCSISAAHRGRLNGTNEQTKPKRSLLVLDHSLYSTSRI